MIGVGAFRQNTSIWDCFPLLLFDTSITVKKTDVILIIWKASQGCFLKKNHEVTEGGRQGGRLKSRGAMLPSKKKRYKI